jgi:hypothetical protein
MNLPHDAQRERLVLLMEEMAEAQQMIGKCLRHGMDSTHRDYQHRYNDQLLADEIGHVLAAIDLVLAAIDVAKATVEASRQAKHEKVKRYLHFQQAEATR